MQTKSAPSPQRKRRAASKTRDPSRYWSKRVTETSNAMDLEPGVFQKPSAIMIAQSVKRSAERSTRRKADPFRSAMSMLVFYINRAGANLPVARRRVLERAKVELRRLFGRTPVRSPKAASSKRNRAPSRARGD